MPTFIRLTKIRSDREEDRYSQSDDPSENVKTQPVTVTPEHFRSVTPRKDNKVGTRITFADGGGYAVTETKDIVESRMIEAGYRIVGND